MARTSEYLQRAADRVMIQDLLARYAWEVDHGDPARWAALFTEDGVFEIPAVKVKAEGRAELAEFAADLQRAIPNVHHLQANFVIELDGDRAWGRCELNEFMARPEAVYPNLQGWYEDDYFYRNGHWLIAHRRVFTAEPKSTVTGKVGEHFQPFHEICKTKWRKA